MEDITKYTGQNAIAWNEIASVRGARWAAKHPIDLLKKGGTLSVAVRQLLGELHRVRVLHLQCATGEDSISLAALGAEVSAIDISSSQIEIARSRAAEVGVEVDFVAADLYSVPAHVFLEPFDLVFTAGGVLCWLPDLRRWAELIASALRPGGKFVIEEIHPVAQVLWGKEGQIVQEDDYFAKDPIEVQAGWTHFDDQGAGTQVKYEFIWRFADIISSLATAGLRIELLQEFPPDQQDYWKFGDALDAASKLPGRFILVARLD